MLWFIIISLSILCYKHFYHFQFCLVRLRVVLSAQRYGFFGIVKKKRTKTGNPFITNKDFEGKVGLFCLVSVVVGNKGGLCELEKW